MYLGSLEFYTIANKIRTIPESRLITALHILTLTVAIFGSPVLAIYIGFVSCFSVRMCQLHSTDKAQQKGIFDAVMYDLFYTIGIVLPVAYGVRLLFFTYCLHSRGRGWMFMWFFVTWQTDNGCLLFGRLFGTHKCSPLLSPNKTWEGVLGGWFFNFVSLELLRFISGDLILPSLTLENTLHISVIVRVMQFICSGQLGDLAESFFKRCGDVKDSGKLLPGHGGILDRLDSLVLGAPALTAYIQFFALG